MNFRKLWTLDPGVAYLNHGSFGACPRAVLDAQAALRERMEREPVQFLSRDLDGLLDAAREVVADFVGADAGNIAFVTNATAGVNTVLRSLRFAPGDELLVTDHAYNACRNALEYAAGRDGAKVVVAAVPFPVAGDDEVVAAVLDAVTPRTRLALIDHVTSPTALVFPIERLVGELRARGVETLADGAHAPGMVPLSLERLGAAYYTGNGHKWPCAPKGAAFLYVRPDRQEEIRPLVISHGANRPLRGRTRFQTEFAWTGTSDPTPALGFAVAIRFMATLLPGGWDELRARNRGLALAAREMLAARLGLGLPCPDEMVGSIANLVLPDAKDDEREFIFDPDPLQAALRERHRVEVPVFAWPAPPKRLLRLSAQLYNEPADYERLADGLAALLPV
ncbi:MAG: aminotransferase class V-fold PLP-dependent enzyme [Chloroflexi bacterium]|nr:aminotransferase class V-fold PLP-dependent enzyme [Chloroflexota bacterium]